MRVILFIRVSSYRYFTMIRIYRGGGGGRVGLQTYGQSNGVLSKGDPVQFFKGKILDTMI